MCHKEVAVGEGKSRIILLSEEVTELPTSLGWLTSKLALLRLSATGTREIGQSGQQSADTSVMT